MKKAKILLIVSLVCVFAAGLALGFLLARWPREGRGRDWLEKRLDLSAEQRTQMREIWSEVARGDGRSGWEEMRELRRQQEQALMDLLTEEQRAEYERLEQEFERKMAEMSEQRRQAFERAVERTKQILTPAQRKKYEELLRHMRPDGRRNGRRGGPPFGDNRGPDGRRDDGPGGRPKP